MLISRGCAWLSMKKGGCKFGVSKTGAVLCPKRGAVVSQLVLKLKESVPPPPPGPCPTFTEKRKGVNLTLKGSPAHVARITPFESHFDSSTERSQNDSVSNRVKVVWLSF